MAEGKVDELADRLDKEVTNELDQKFVIALLDTRFAAALENGDEDVTNNIFPSVDEAWVKTNEFLKEISEKDPDKAIKDAVALLLLPKSLDPQKESVNSWMRSTGLTLLGLTENVRSFDKYLGEGTHKDELFKILADNIGVDIENFDKPEHFSNPLGFTVVQSVHNALGLKDAESVAAKRLYALAEPRRKDPDIIHATNIIKTFPGCKYLEDRILA
jgi:hypothetical protein